jgi:histidinol-phosphate aminotransferase
MRCLEPNSGILATELYVPGKSRVPGSDHIIKLSSNETPFGPSAVAIEAFIRASVDMGRYPDGNSTALRNEIGDKYDLDPERIVCGAGSDELLNLLAQAYLGPGDEAIYTEHGFLVYRTAIMVNSARPVVASERNLTVDVDSILDCVHGEKTKVVFIANPNNPTGTYLNFAEISRLRRELPDHTLLVLDAAYAEYVTNDDYSAGIELVDETENTVMTRTFSKIHGLAGLRIGWAYCPYRIADVLNRVRGPFNVSAPAISASVAALRDISHVEKSIESNRKEMNFLSKGLLELGLGITPSVANFLLIHFPDNTNKTAAMADEFLNNKGIILRRVTSYGFPNALRMTVGKEDDNKAVLSVLSDFMSGIDK